MNTASLKPRVSEKAYALSENGNTYIFDIEPGTNKHAVARAVARQYDVTVENVRIAGVPGKSQKRYRDRGRKSISGRRSDIRKAFVTLKDGDKLPFFAGMEEGSSKPEKESK